MTAIYARARSKEAPMVGIEFTNRANTVPAWRAGDQDKENANNIPVKRSHDNALPPLTPFDPKNGLADIPQPVFGENLHYLFRPPQINQPSSPWAGPSTEIPEVDMKDVELTPPRSHRHLEQTGDYSSRSNDEKEKVEYERSRLDEADSPERRRISNAAVRRIARRRKEARRHPSRLRGSSKPAASDGDDSLDEDDDDGSLRKERRITRNTSNHYTLNMPGPPSPKTDTPYILLGYLQFMFNLSLILVFLYLLVQFIFTVQRDLEERIGEYTMDILQEITTCAQQYKQNLCDTSPIPAMLHQCATWDTCMNRDPKVVGRARVGAEMLAEVVNSFIEPISWKTLLFTLSSLAFMTVFVNSLIMLYRARLHPDKQHPHAPPASHTPNLTGHVPMSMPNFPPSFHTAYGYLPAGQMPPPGLSWGQPQPLPEANLGDRMDGPEEMPRQRRRLENGESTALVVT